jgi:hypothetical protein
MPSRNMAFDWIVARKTRYDWLVAGCLSISGRSGRVSLVDLGPGFTNDSGRLPYTATEQLFNHTMPPQKYNIQIDALKELPVIIRR